MRPNMSIGRMHVCLVAACVVAGPGRVADAAILYSIDRNNNRLVEVDTVGWTFNPVGTGLGQVVRSTDLAIANGRLYAVDTPIAPPGPVYVLEIDTVTGLAGTPILLACPSCIPPAVTHAEGLAQAGGNLYVAFNFNPTLNPSTSHAVGLLDPATGVISNPIIDYQPLSPGADFDGLTEFPCGLTAFPTGNLFAVDHNPGPQTHTYFALSGTIAVNGFFPDVPITIAVNDLAFCCGGILYGIDHGRRLVTIHNPTTGEIIGTSSTQYSAQWSLTGLACREPCVPTLMSMVAWWPLDDDPGPTALELVGANDGTHVGGPIALTGEAVDNSLCFDGIGQYVGVPDAPPLNFNSSPDFTIDAWVRADDVTGTRPIVDKIDAAVPRGYQLFVVNGRLGFRMADPCTDYVAPTADVTLGVWHHVAVTVFRSGIAQGKLYVDGNLVHSFVPQAASVVNGANLSIGRAQASPCGPATFWEGCIDEVEFFDEALSIGDIRAIRDSCRGGKCKPHCCLPDGRCVTMLEPDCLALGGFPVDDCLGDLDSNGIDDACECGLVEQGAAGPYCEGVCPGPLPPVLACTPRCLNYNSTSGLVLVTECDCLGLNECRVVDNGIGQPSCQGNCTTGGICVETVTVLGDGTIDICCDCLPAPPIPAVSEWGLIAMTLLVLIAGTLILRPRARKISVSRVTEELE